MNSETNPVLIGHKEAARLCGVSPSAWFSYVAAGKTPRPIHLGRRTLFRRGELLDWIEAGCPAREKWEQSRKTS